MSHPDESQQADINDPSDSDSVSTTSNRSDMEDEETVEHYRHSNPSKRSTFDTGEASARSCSRSSPGSSDPVLHSAVGSGDFGKVVQLKAYQKLTDHEKLILLTKHFIPRRNYKFPPRLVSGRNRHFQQSWLDQYNGLVYSETENGRFCKYCVLFATESPSMELGVFVNRPLIDFKRATEKLSDHFRRKKFHKASMEAAAFTSVMKNHNLAIDHRLSSERSKRAAGNHRKLLSHCRKSNILWMTATSVQRPP